MAGREFIKIPRLLILISGFWPFPITKNAIYAKIYYVYSRIQLILYVSFIASITINMLILIIKHDQPTRMFSSINVVIIVSESCLKLLVFQAKKIPSMFAHTMAYEQRIENLNDEEVKTFFNNQTIYCRWINCVQIVLTTVSCATYALVSIVELIRIEDLSFYKNAPFMHDVWYPFRKEEHMKWVVFINMIIIVQGTVFNSTTQTTFICLMIYATTRFGVLQIRLKKFDRIANEEYQGNILGVIRDLIAEHQESISFVKALNDNTKYVMLLEFVLNSIGLAAGIIQLVVKTTTGGYIAFLTIVILLLSQIFILSWSANEISLESSKISDAIFESNWEDYSQQVKAYFITMSMGARKPLGLTAGPFFQMSTNTAISTVKVAYTYLSLMLRNFEV